MLFTIALVFLVLWLLGVVAVPVTYVLWHGLLVIAVVLVIVQLLEGRRGQ